MKREILKYEKKYETEKELDGDLSFFQYKSKLPISKPLINIITRKHPEKIHIFMAPKENKMNISARDQSDKIGVNKLLEAATKNFKHAKSGGHPRASGGQIQAKDLRQFKQNLKDYIKKQL
jgi:single-stranded DNA-specific DHH superfamily exonuclease